MKLAIDTSCTYMTDSDLHRPPCLHTASSAPCLRSRFDARRARRILLLLLIIKQSFLLLFCAAAVVFARAGSPRAGRRAAARPRRCPAGAPGAMGGDTEKEYAVRRRLRHREWLAGLLFASGAARARRARARRARASVRPILCGSGSGATCLIRPHLFSAAVLF